MSASKKISFFEANMDGQGAENAELMEMRSFHHGRGAKESEASCFHHNFCEQSSKLWMLEQCLSFRLRRPSRLNELLQAASKDGLLSRQVKYRWFLPSESLDSIFSFRMLNGHFGCWKMAANGL